MSLDLLGHDIKTSLIAAGFQVISKQQQAPKLITWKRIIPQSLTTSGELTDKFTIEPHLVYFLSGKELVNLVNNNLLFSDIETIQKLYPAFHIHLLISGLKSYCRTHRGCVSRTQTEFALTEIQLLQNCSHRMLESAEEVASTICQFAKSIAEEPFKRQKMDRFEKETFFLGNDSKDCVKIQNGIGLSRLWQQQLTKLPMVTLEVAEAITIKYPMPAMLIQGLRESNMPERLLEDLPIRRSGNATTQRRIGPELSRKVYNLFLNSDPNAVI